MGRAGLIKRSSLRGSRNWRISMVRIKTDSFQLKLTGRFLWRLLAALLVLLLVLESAARLPWPVGRIPPPSVESTGTGELLDIKLHHLEQFSLENGGVDVILFGSSLVHTGLDPLVMENIFQVFRQSGRLARCVLCRSQRAISLL